jgi:PIN domain nuclease of toxin-antitoxin system
VAIAASRKLPRAIRELLIDSRNDVFYSASSTWELAIKSALGRADFRVDLTKLLQAVVDTGFVELPVTSVHAARVATLPDLHPDSFDRLLVAQALTEPAILLTNDARLGPSGANVRVF